MAKVGLNGWAGLAVELAVVVLACSLAGCAAVPAAREVADVSGIKTELAAVQGTIRDIKATTNYDTDVWANRGLLLVPLAVSWLFMRMANKRALCEARKHGYWEQRSVRIGSESQIRKEPK